jgi:uroporphyrin-III C-methyltransferase
MKGKVYLVGGGPGDPELLTLKAAKILGRADVVLHDALVSSEVLALVAVRAELVDVGKRCGRKLLTQEEINALMISYAESHEVVVRLKGGDPLLFGRAGEEIAALRQAGMDFEIVPGITAGFGAAAAAGFPLTDRRVASQVLFTTIQRDTDNRSIQWGGISSTTTLVLYMPGTDYARVMQQLRDAGWPDDMPCAIVSHASGKDQAIRSTVLATLADEGALPAPAIMIVGRVVAEVVEEIGREFRIGPETAERTSRRLVIGYLATSQTKN